MWAVWKVFTNILMAFKPNAVSIKNQQCNKIQYMILLYFDRRGQTEIINCLNKS